MDRQLDEARAQLAMSMVGYALGLPVDEMITARRGSAGVAYGRQIAMYAVYVCFGISLARVAIAFGRDRSTVAHACHLIEDRRDDIDLDEWLDELEAALKQVAGLTPDEKAVA